MLKIKSGVAVGAVLSLIIAFSLAQSFTAYGVDDYFLSAPGGNVSDAQSMYEALGGEKAARLGDDGSIMLYRDIALESPVVISGGEYLVYGAGCEMSGDASGEAFYISEGASLTLGVKNENTDDGLTIQNGDGSEKSLIIVCEDAYFALEDGVVLSGHAERGGALFVSGGKAEIFGGGISGCSADLGGAIFISSGLVTVKGGVIEGCTAGDGGAVYIESGSFVLEDGVIGRKTKANSNGGSDTTGSPCDADNYGGGIFVKAGRADLLGGDISECAAVNGGGIYIASSASVCLGGTTIEESSASGFGGGIYNGGSADCQLTRVKKCNATFGGGVANFGEFAVTNGDFTDCTATEAGGGIYNESSFSFASGSITNDGALYGEGVNNKGSFEFSGGVIGHCTNTDGSQGSAFLNTGTLSMSGKAFVYDDSYISLVITPSGYNPMIVSGFSGAEIMARVSVFTEITGSDGALTYKASNSTGQKVIDGASAAEIEKAAAHLKIISGEKLISVDSSGKIAFHLNSAFITAIIVVALLSLAFIIILFIKRKARSKQASEQTKQ